MSAIFNGTSRFSTDFQQVLTRAVNIASLPITQLTNQVSVLQARSSALTTLDTKFSALQTAIQGLQNATGISSYTASVSDNSIAQVSLSTGASPATYALEVTSLGAYSNTLSTDSLPKVTDPATQNLSTATTFGLTVDGVTTYLTPQAATLNSLVNSINTQPGLNVQASLVNIGSNSIPDYRLSLQSTKLGPVSIQLDGGGPLLSSLGAGSLASYKVNGILTDITSDSRNITLAPGVSATLLHQSPTGVAATITVANPTLGVSNALSTLVNAYNAATDALNATHGKSGGSLQGQSLVGTLSNALRQLANFNSGSSGINSLASLGVTYNTSGHLTFDSTVFSSATGGQIASLNNFLGTPTSGGFLENATHLLASVDNATTGAIHGASTAVLSEITSSQARIDATQARVDKLQHNLQVQLAKSDALVASLEQSYSVLNGLIQAQALNSQSRNSGF
jgi:flagellar hook-associated protein 2